MNHLGIDFGTKKIGLAISIQGVISPLTSINNNSSIFDSIKKYIDLYKINSIYIGLSPGKMGELTLNFIDKLKSVVKLPIETVEETASTIEADTIFVSQKHKKKSYPQAIDALSAAIILRRVIN